MGVNTLPAKRNSRRDPEQASDENKSGNWSCPKCSDWQFARNIECRKCGTPKIDSIRMVAEGNGERWGHHKASSSCWDSNQQHNDSRDRTSSDCKTHGRRDRTSSDYKTHGRD